MKNIAVITGASSGMGRIFAETVDSLGTKLDEVWVIARREERLLELKCPYPVKAVAMDLSDRGSFKAYAEMLKAEAPNILLLVNASGYGKFDAFCRIELETNLNMVDLNCQALQAMCHISIPYMKSGSKIVNFASIAAFQPVPYIDVYAASKAFVLSFSRALNRELKPKGIHVMALCPYWTKTEFFRRAVVPDDKTVVKKYMVMYRAEDVVARAWKDLHRGKDVCLYGFVSRLQVGLYKFIPMSLTMSLWLKQQKL